MGDHLTIFLTLSLTLNLTLTLTLTLLLTLSLTLNLTLTIFLTLSLTLNVTVIGLGGLPRFCRLSKMVVLVVPTFVILSVVSYRIGVEEMEALKPLCPPLYNIL